jgi:hypothetical protein
MPTPLALGVYFVLFGWIIVAAFKMGMIFQQAPAISTNSSLNLSVIAPAQLPVPPPPAASPAPPAPPPANGNGSSVGVKEAEVPRPGAAKPLQIPIAEKANGADQPIQRSSAPASQLAEK